GICRSLIGWRGWTAVLGHQILPLAVLLSTARGHRPVDSLRSPYPEVVDKRAPPLRVAPGDPGGTIRVPTPDISSMTVTATYEGTEIARSNRTVVVEGNHYFPAEDVLEGVLEPSGTQTTCPWKGVARYYD